jgi:hypothetical protein
MKNILIILITLLCIEIISGQSEIEYSQGENYISKDKLIIYLDTIDFAKVIIKESFNTNLNITVKVSGESGKRGVLEYLKKTGRYQLDFYENQNSYASILSLRNKNHEIFINGNSLQDKVIYTLYIPENIQYIIKLPEENKKATLAIR